MMRRAVVVLEGDRMEVVGRALEPEGGCGIPRVRVHLTRGPRRVVLQVEAQDTSALRAALNSYLRWASVALKMRDEVRG
jgi:tRNA threonylcarbamoyladenosine modification (KEOPS) complex  Pcc1 subunit